MSRDSFIRMRGVWDTRHWIKVPGLQVAQQATLKAALSDIEGVSAVLVYPNRRKIRISYDQRMLDISTILNTLQDIGTPAAHDWWSSRKWAWFQYLDETARENANAPAANCCSKPKGISRPR